jgi:hypothetical protein
MGLVAAALGGLVAGAGQGAAKIGDEMYTDQNLKLKAQLDTDRDAYLHQLDNSAAQTRTETSVAGQENVANIGAASAATTTGMQVQGRHQDTQAEIAARTADVAAQIAGRHEDVKAETGASLGAAAMHWKAYMDSARNLNTDADGNAYTVIDGKATPLLNSDGSQLKTAKDVSAGTKLMVDGWQRQIGELQKDLMDPQKGMMIRSDPGTEKVYRAEIARLTGNVYKALGVDPTKFTPPDLTGGAAGAAAPSGTKPPLSSFYANPSS